MPYVLGLAQRGWRYIVLSFEKRDTADAEAQRRVREALAAARVRWLALRYHRRPSVVATAADMLRGVLAALRPAGEVSLIHARSTVPAAMALILSRLLRSPWVFDVRGLVGEEYADAKHWRRDGVLHRLTTRVERHLLARSGGLVLLTHAIRDELTRAGSLPSNKPIVVIPCVVDVDAFRPNPEARGNVRRTLGMREEPLLIYHGSVGSWYRLDEMITFFLTARRTIPGLRFLILTPQEKEARHLVAQLDPVTGISIGRALPEEVPAYLAAADAGICFLEKCFSKKASSPTKYGEYLACGLPVIADSWTGDSCRLSNEVAWIAVERFHNTDYELATRRLLDLLQHPDRARASARELALREFSLTSGLDRYEALYRQVIEATTE
jgi:glycosyltransferase involved in cell wall biosynthesis